MCRRFENITFKDTSATSNIFKNLHKHVANQFIVTFRLKRSKLAMQYLCELFLLRVFCNHIVATATKNETLTCTVQ